MEKQIKRFEIDYSLGWDGTMKLSEIEQDIAELKKLGATHIDIRAINEWEETFIVIKALHEREETDAEFESRVKSIERGEERKRMKELALLEELKLKYEKIGRIEKQE